MRVCVVGFDDCTVWMTQSVIAGSPLMLRHDNLGNNELEPATRQLLILDTLSFQDLLDGDYC